MGGYDGAEICELVGLFILHHLEQKLNLTSIGLYRDDGLAAMKNHSGPKADRTRKQLIQIFQSFGLQITVQTNLKSINFLDINLNLETGIHQPYRKPNDLPMYINAKSNHPPIYAIIEPRRLQYYHRTTTSSILPLACMTMP